MTEKTISPLLRRPEVQRQTGLSRSAIYRQMDAGTFPRQRKIDRKAVAWSQDEIEAWKASRPVTGT